MKKILILTVCAILVAACSNVSLYRLDGQEYAINDDGDIYRKGPDGYWTFAYESGGRNRDHQLVLDQLTKRGVLVEQISQAELDREPPLAPGDGVRLPTSLPPAAEARKRRQFVDAILPEADRGH